MTHYTITVSIHGGVGYLDNARATSTLVPGDTLTILLHDYDVDPADAAPEALHGDEQEGYYVECDSTTLTVTS